MPPFLDRVTPTPTESDAQGMFSVQTIYVAHFVFFFTTVILRCTRIHSSDDDVENGKRGKQRTVAWSSVHTLIVAMSL